MEVIIGEEEGTPLEIPLQDCDVNKTGSPVLSPASYGRTPVLLPKYIKYALTMPLSN
jgi:hypothetical protein